MTDVDSIVLADDTPQADAVDQRLAVDPDAEIVFDGSYLDVGGDRDANDADLIDQAIIVPVPDGDWDYNPPA
ncbi:hypothetical protein ACAG26_09065 [Mycobacterium sp. pUA109]|uniref:hypothetical protein n=1 Tax=Mycobacterium sp. pUA109 TaxID=3238982 RepID=UPI00351B519B